MKEHELKTIQPYFNDVYSGIKNFEVRKNNRDFVVGDYLVLKHYDEIKNRFNGAYVLAKIMYILKDIAYCKDGYVVLGIEVLTKGWKQEYEKDLGA